MLQRGGTAAQGFHSPAILETALQALSESAPVSMSSGAKGALEQLEEMHGRISSALEWIFPSLYAPTWFASVRLTIYSTSIWCTLILLTAWRYKSQKRSPYGEETSLLLTESDFREWTSGPFECCQDMNICLWACVCPCIRWSDTLEIAGLARFWVGLTFCGTVVLMNSLPSFLMLWLVLSLIWMAFRQQLRRRFAMEHDSPSTVFGDWVLYCFCCPCAVAQEARHVEAACRAGHKAVTPPAPCA